MRESGFANVRIVGAIAIVAAFSTLLPLNSSAQTFADVPTEHWAFSFIETVAARGISAGCGGENFCPQDNVTRAQMAVFLERGMHGSGFSPTKVTGDVFLDVAVGDFAANFIERLAEDGITAGCGNGNFCPNAMVTRAQMAVFLLRAKYGSDYLPPPGSGVFNDVPPNYWSRNWIEQLAVENITAGCGNGNYCPISAVTRAEMAVFLVRTFNLNSLPNIPPSVIIDLPQDTISEKKSLGLSAISSDADGSIVAYRWRQVSGPAVTFDSTESDTILITAPYVSELSEIVIELEVEDNGRAISITSTQLSIVDDKSDPQWVFSRHHVPALTRNGPLTGSFTYGAAVFDVNNDGRDDIIFAGPSWNSPTGNWRGNEVPLSVFINQGDYSFLDDPPAMFGNNTPPTQIHTREIRLADVNADGEQDVLMIGHGWDIPPFSGEQVVLILSAENDHYDGSSQLGFAQSGFFHSGSIGDLNSDGYPDILIANIQGIPETLITLINDGSGTFSEQSILPAELVLKSSYFTTEIADVDLDGCQDVLAANPDPLRENDPEYDSRSFVVWSDCNGGFEAFALAYPIPKIVNHELILDFEVADISGDGLPDILLVLTDPQYINRSIQVLENNGNRTFTDKSNIYFPAASTAVNVPFRLSLIDLDSDGDLDIVMLIDGRSEQTPFDLIWENVNGQFAPRLEYLMEWEAPYIPIDIDGDGDIDLIARRITDFGDESQLDEFFVIENMSETLPP